MPTNLGDVFLNSIGLVGFRCLTCQRHFRKFRFQSGTLVLVALLLLAISVAGFEIHQRSKPVYAAARITLNTTTVKLGQQIVLHVEVPQKGWTGELAVDDLHHFMFHTNVYRLLVTPDNGFDLMRPNAVTVELKNSAGQAIPLPNFGQFQIKIVPSDVSVSPEDADIGDNAVSDEILVNAASDYSWSVRGIPDWINITSGASGKGSGAVAYKVAQNNTNQPRSAVLQIGDRYFEIKQARPPQIVIPYEETFSSGVTPAPVWSLAKNATQPGPDAGTRWVIDEQPGRRTALSVKSEGPDNAPSLVAESKQSDPRAWATQIYLPNIRFIEGAKYRVSTYLKADNPTTILLMLGQNSKPYAGCGFSETIPVSQSWNAYTFPLEVSGDNCGSDNNRLSFQLGKLQGKLWISKISIRKGAEALTRN